MIIELDMDPFRFDVQNILEQKIRSSIIPTYLSSLPILAVVYRFFYLPTANLPIYHNLPISTDFFADLPNFNFFYWSFCYFM